MLGEPSEVTDAIGVKASTIELTYDKAINYAFQQNAIPIIRELRYQNDASPRRDVVVRVSTEPAFAPPIEVRVQAIEPDQEIRLAPIELKLSHDYLAQLNERVSGWLKVEVQQGENIVCSVTEPIELLARNEWCGLVSLPEILAAFVLPNDPAVMTVLGRASEILREHTGRAAFTGYGDKSRRRAWEQMAAIYRAVSELGIRYIVPPASFETTGQKVRLPTHIEEQRFGTCLDLALLFAACFEQAGLHPLLLMHDGHAYAGCWLEQWTMPESCSDDLQHIRKLVTDELVTVFETTLVASETPGTLEDAERSAKPHLLSEVRFRLALDIRSARVARIHPLPIPGQVGVASGSGPVSQPALIDGLGNREFVDAAVVAAEARTTPATRIDHWKSRLLDLTLRNRLLNFRETKSTIQILSAAPEKVEDDLANDIELSLHPKPTLMSERDPRDAAIYTKQHRADALLLHLQDELSHRRLHTTLEEKEHSRRLTELFRATRTALEENGTNTLFAAVGFLEWRETEHSDRVLRAPILLVPVELRRKSVLEGFSLRRLDEDTRLNVTLMEMLRQHFHKNIAGLDPLPEDDNGVDVAKVLRTFRDAVRDLAGWEVKAEIWLGQFSFTKYLLWNDLTTRLDRLMENPIVDHLVNRAGVPYPNSGRDILPSDLDRSFHPRQIFCPRSADSSQLAAVMAAAAGQDFVLEGPPGTGKSQTITNIIVHCLAEGKRVLFVAEKRAALDVVHRRLREVGLEPFCLELHSNKAGKSDVLAQFDRTLKCASPETPTDWEQRSSELGAVRNVLNEYTRVLHLRHPCGLSAYQCLDYLLPGQGDTTVRLDGWTSILTTSAETLARARELARLMQERTRDLAPLTDHGLASLACEEWTPVWAERTLARVQELAQLTDTALHATHELYSWMRRPSHSASRGDLSNALLLVDSLLAPRPVGRAFATTAWVSLERQLDSLVTLVRERVELRRAVGEVLEPEDGGTVAVRPEKWSAPQEHQALQFGAELLLLIPRVAELASELRVWLRAPQLYHSKQQLGHLDSLAKSLLETPTDVGGALATENWNATTRELGQWTDLVRERLLLRGQLTAYDEARLLVLDFDGIERVWNSASGSWFLPKWLRTRRVRRDLRPARHDGRRPRVDELTAVIKAGRRLRTINDDLAAAHSHACAVLGPTWKNGEPDPGELDRIRTWGDLLHQRIEAATADHAGWPDELRARFAEILNGGRSAFIGAGASVSLLARYRNAFAEFGQSSERLASSAPLRRTRLDSSSEHLASVSFAVKVLLECVPRLRMCNTSLSAASAAADAFLGSIWQQGEPSADAILDAKEWGEVLHARMGACAGSDSAWFVQIRELLATLFTEGCAAYGRGTATGATLVRFTEAHAHFDQALQSLTDELRLRRELFDSAPDHLEAVQDLTRGAEAAWPSLRVWCSWQRARREAVDLGLGPIVTMLESPGGHLLDIPKLFERSFRRAFFFASIESERAIREFFGREHDERIQRFRDIDEELSTLTSELVRSRLAAEIPRDRRKDNIPAPEIGLLRKEIGKKTRHIPVRQLLSRIPTLLPRLKPCLLMSPLSVAQYLDATQDHFDIVIFDEASQIPVWDAVGAIARGMQLVVVGDPKQLPPTNFFNTSDEDDQDSTPEEHKDLESILDELLSNGVRHKRLRWHYRSRHEGLITFSNRLYYENDLLTFPSPTTEHGGVRFKYIPGAVYDKGKSRTNRAEAVALVNELVSRLRSTVGPERSYGVVTFSQAQQALVEDLLDEERRNHPEIEHHFGDDPPIEGEPVFVKNLENVQGDERDVILFSVCYGPDETGRVSMTFGPLNRDGGERRLNVAVTRAKHEVLVVSGLRADQIDLTRTRSKGVRDLKYFLDYAERGPRALAAATTGSADAVADSEFERMVATSIRAAGFEVHHQVGCSGYRIDLAIVDPRAPGRYLLGIECDGATYHRAATARDRDKLRQSVLEGLGWHVHRIWSTDWWHDTKRETARLLEHVRRRQAEASEVQVL
jgi:very-short-patch-repair endonuclease